LHYDTASRNYSETIDVGKLTTCAVSNLVAGKKYYFIVTAYNPAGKESPPSNEFLLPFRHQSRQEQTGDEPDFIRYDG
jgi:hypothetical protein